MANAVPIRRNPLGQGPLAVYVASRRRQHLRLTSFGCGFGCSPLPKRVVEPVFFSSTAEPALQINH